MLSFFIGVATGGLLMFLYDGLEASRRRNYFTYRTRQYDRSQDPAERWTIRGIDARTRSIAMAKADALEVNVGAVVAAALDEMSAG